MKRMQLVLAFVSGFALTLAFCACGDNNTAPNLDSFTYGDFDQFPKFKLPDRESECPLPPPEQMEDGCRFYCETTGNHWKCTEICECE